MSAFPFTIPNIPIFTPIQIPSLPTLYTLEELLGVSDLSELLVPYVPPEITAYDPALYALQQQAIDLELAISNSLADLGFAYEIMLENRGILTTYNAELATLRGQLDTQKTSLTALQSTLTQNATSLNNATKDYESKVNALNADAKNLDTAQKQVAASISSYNADVATYNTNKASLTTLQVLPTHRPMPR